MRFLSHGVASLVLAFVFVLTGVLSVAASSPTLPAAPTALAMSKGGKVVAAGGWINAIHIALQFNAAAASQPLTPQVEVQPANTPFTGTPNFTGKPVTTTGPVIVHAYGLQPNRKYHWQARLQDPAGNVSEWVPFGAGTPYDFGIDQTSPTRPVISSPTDARSDAWYNNQVVTLRWQSTDSGSGILGYHYVMERRLHGIKPGPLTPRAQVNLPHLGDGVWYVAVRAEDRAGNWSAMSTFRLQLLRTPPAFTWLSPAHFTFNPYRGPTTFRFSVTQTSRVSLALYRVGSKTPVRTFAFPTVAAKKVMSITWAGKHGKGFVPKGYYFISARAVDVAGNVAHINYGGISVQPQRAVMSATGQPLYPDGGKIIIVSLS
ncbi:MAG TPA: hypothetical protein VFA78_09865, partial [Chloroflexota bacterium]|nr:hypothetical protein [Chloroflexota bacterium]